MATEPQLTLPLYRPPPASFEQFIDSGNETALRALRAFIASSDETLFYLGGGPGSGKTHLLTAACAEIERNGGRPAYAPLREADRLSPELLHGLERCDLVCLDDLDAITGQRDWEIAIFHLFNRLREAGQRLLIAAHALPANLDVALPDLRSRLQWGTSFRLHEADDALKRRIVKARATRLGMPLDDELIDYLFKRHSRDLHELIALVERLDKLSLARKRRVTLPLLRELLTSR